MPHGHGISVDFARWRADCSNRRVAGRVAFVLEALYWAGIFAASAIGVASLTGWVSGRPELIRLHESFAPAQPTTALSLVSLALALMLAAHGPPRAARIVAVVPIAFAGLALLSGWLGLVPTIERGLAGALGGAQADVAGTMGPALAIGILAVAAGVFLLTSPGSRRFAIGFTVPVFVVTLPIFAGYVTGSAATGETGPFALHVGIALLAAAFALGAVSMAPSRREAPRWIWMPVAVAVLMAAPILLTWEGVASDGGVESTLPHIVLFVGILVTAALGFAIAAKGRDVSPLAVRIAGLSTGGSSSAAAMGDDLFRALAVVAPAGIYVTDAHGRCLFVNELWCHLADLSPESATGERWRETLHIDDRDRVLQRWALQSRAGDAFHDEYRFVGRGGRVSWVEDRATPLLHEDGRLAGYVGVVVDVGARREAEQADHDRNASWRLAIEAQQVALFEWNLETDVVLWSPRLHDVLGFDGFGASRPGAFRALAHPDDRMRLEHAVAEHLGADAALRLMLRLRLREGGFGQFIFAGLAERDECGRPCRLCGSLLELTNDLVSYAP